MKKIKESDVIDRLKKNFGEDKLTRFVPSPYSPRGIADCCVDVDGVTVWIEIKISNKLTKNQEKFLESKTYSGIVRYDKRSGTFTFKDFGKKIVPIHIADRIEDCLDFSGE